MCSGLMAALVTRLSDFPREGALLHVLRRGPPAGSVIARRVLGGGCVPATNGAEALAVMDGARVSLALLDMRMPVLDGWGFARELRALIVMSAGVNAQQWTDEIGAAGCVSKPFDPLVACSASGSFPHVVWSVRA